MNAPILDTEVLVADLRLCTTYASRLGLLRDATVLESLKRAQDAMDHQQAPDVQMLSQALNDVVRVIAPMTIADLRFGRDPLSEKNQRKAKILQLVLTTLALVMLGLIGFFMQSLRNEQEAVQTLNQIQELHPQEKLNALRVMAQFDKPVERRSVAYEAYHQKVIELMQINSKISRSFTGAVVARDIPLFPTPGFLADVFNAHASIITTAQGPAPASESGEAPPATITTVSSKPLDLCSVDDRGEMVLPADATRLPTWLRSLLSDSFSDFCFQLKVLAGSGQGALLSSSLVQLNYLPEIRDKIALRLNWFLPFFYGVLGSVIYVMRNVANLRTPAMDGFPITMRIALGGVAGIVIGWFSTFTGPALESNSNSLSVPFALAFLTGYGIELLFNLLDKLIRSAGEARSAS